MNFCKDCANLTIDGITCARGPYIKGVDPVTGNEIRDYKVIDYARQERKGIMPWKCGKNARFFKAKEQK
ncbi:hypothetical protein BcepF1.077 [Burkholderia phage BcepF1]|uniref:Uncharacterized protein n=1 Tax=Burkholderia phage BcepF1 TaxID=2886897 RepID=A1YZY1_9CAUD|nr:hypothetical protein BcepF1.077 [Burkholderia phage BcepF1]ABL96808.1 hypothetical protein BcepF1.077 [Burkholderia phage BcepF1]